MEKHRIFSTLIDRQRTSYELILTSVIVALGVNLLSSGIVELVGKQYKGIILTIIGIILSVGIILKLIQIKFKEINQTAKIDGFIIYNDDTHELLDVPEYRICSDMVNYLKAAFSENKALEKLWMNNNICSYRDNKGKEAELTGRLTHSGTLFLELLEYCVINKLSTHLTDYFNQLSDKAHVQVIQKADIPEVLLNNRFLKLFSEDMINRAIFADEPHWNEDNAPKGKVVCAYTSTGGIYHMFDLVLPENSKVYKKGKNSIVIETPILILTIRCGFNNLSALLESGFEQYYLGLDLNMENMMTYHTYRFDVEVSVKFKLRSLISKEKEMYYTWIDSFIDTLFNYMGRDVFFSNINWKTVYTMILCKLTDGAQRS